MSDSSVLFSYFSSTVSLQLRVQSDELLPAAELHSTVHKHRLIHTKDNETVFISRCFELWLSRLYSI